MLVELPWDGTPFKSPWIAWDTETTVVNLKEEVPELVCLTASDGVRTVVVFPDKVENFWAHHHQKHLVAWNLAFDWWVLHSLLKEESYYGEGALWAAVDLGLFHDAMLMEQLVRLGEGKDDEGFYGRSLKDVAWTWLGEELSKDDTIRKGFTPDMAKDWPSHMESWEYAAKDAEVLARLWPKLVESAELIESNTPPGVSPPLTSRSQFGLLSEQVQVKGALALQLATRNGLALDRAQIALKFEEYDRKCRNALADLSDYIPGLVKCYKRTGQPILTKTTGLPQLSQERVRASLTGWATSRGLEVPMTADKKNPKPSIAADWWSTYRGHSATIDAWLDYQESTKILQLLRGVHGKDETHPDYRAMVRTGRTSANSVNIQQIPREGWFRSLFVARPGFQLVTADYSFIELVTLASIMEYRYGKSVMADVIRSGVDPHAYTASVVRGCSLPDFLSLKESDPETFKRDRQAAKAINFGVPGGLGASKLRLYALANYGVDLSREQAGSLRTAVSSTVYPELTEWLKDDLAVRLSLSLGCLQHEVVRVFGDPGSGYMDVSGHPIARVVSGHEEKLKGGRFSPYYVEDIWNGLEHCLSVGSGCPQWVDAGIRNRETSPALSGYLFSVPSVIPTGRVRREARYTEYRNTQFQGLASDGAKLALWRLTVEGFRIVAFVHDEIVVEVPTETADESSRRITAIMRDEFARALPTAVPVGVSCVVGARWEK